MQSTLTATARAGLAALALLAVSGFALSGAAQAQNRVVEIVNDTGVTMIEFYASNVDRGGWEENILAGGVLLSGYSVDIDIDDGSGQCLFDFLAVFDDGTEAEDYRINVCELEVYTYE